MALSGKLTHIILRQRAVNIYIFWDSQVLYFINFFKVLGLNKLTNYGIFIFNIVIVTVGCKFCVFGV